MAPPRTISVPHIRERDDRLRGLLERTACACHTLHPAALCAESRQEEEFNPIDRTAAATLTGATACSGNVDEDLLRSCHGAVIGPVLTI